MKYIKTFEVKQQQIDIATKEFFDKYESYKNGSISNGYKKMIEMAKMYSIPSSLHEEFCILGYLYDKDWNWKKGITIVDKRVKDQVKNEIKNRIIQKFEDDPKLYSELKKIVEKVMRVRSSVAYIKYIFLQFFTAIRHAPEWITDTTKYNL